VRKGMKKDWFYLTITQKDSPCCDLFSLFERKVRKKQTCRRTGACWKIFVPRLSFFYGIG